jgi:hypothetical protein
MRRQERHNSDQHTAYIASWLEALKKDKNEIFRAASAASKATDYNRLAVQRRDHPWSSVRPSLMGILSCWINMTFSYHHFTPVSRLSLNTPTLRPTS